MSDKCISWEQAVVWLREQIDQQTLVMDCYFEDPVLGAAMRFADSSEWQAVKAWLPYFPGRALDIGAGRGIGSFALARDGWSVTALEPDPSLLVGAEAIRALAGEAGLDITVVEEFGEKLPFDDSHFDLVYGRQVLHHAQDLPQLCRETARVLRPGGRFVAVREHVISRKEDLDVFLANHPLHKYYGGENAYMLEEYVSAISASGLRLQKIVGPFDSVINYFPMTYDAWRVEVSQPLARRIGPFLTQLLTTPKHGLGQWLLAKLAHRLSEKIDTPGRLYSFVAVKPG